MSSSYLEERELSMRISGSFVKEKKKKDDLSL